MTQPPRVLLVEDEHLLVELEQDVLERSGFRVEAATRGQRALECLERCDEFALMLLDYRLPDMTGADIVEALGDRIAFLPVVMVTGYPDPEIERQMRAAGVRDYIIKDIGMSFLDNLPKAANAALS